MKNRVDLNSIDRLDRLQVSLSYTRLRGKEGCALSSLSIYGSSR